jgi:hypothetical protein
MSERIHALAQQMLGKTSWEECSPEELQQLAKRYPFFAPAQFIYLQKLKETDLPAFEKQQQKGILYFPDPLQFNYFLSDKKFAQHETIPVNTDAPVIYDTASTVEDFDTEESSLLQQAALHPVDAIQKDALEFSTNTTDLSGTPEIFQEKEETVIPHQPEEVENIYLSFPDEIAVGNEQTIAEVTAAETEEAEKIEGKTAEAPGEPNLSDENEAAPHLPSHDAQQQYPVQLSPQVSTPTGIDLAVPTSDDAPLFEPFHTVDYFASQGIKITVDELPKDKLSKQMRSFTEWLKVMKRLPAAEAVQSVQSSAEKKVESMAGHSVKGSEVVTEAMAEVWAKQGATQKAVETYNKLSLLNPSKKAYFAAKIENLKGS